MMGHDGWICCDNVVRADSNPLNPIQPTDWLHRPWRTRGRTNLAGGANLWWMQWPPASRCKCTSDGVVVMLLSRVCTGRRPGVHAHVRASNSDSATPTHKMNTRQRGQGHRSNVQLQDARGNQSGRGAWCRPPGGQTTHSADHQHSQGLLRGASRMQPPVLVLGGGRGCITLSASLAVRAVANTRH